MRYINIDFILVAAAATLIFVVLLPPSFATVTGVKECHNSTESAAVSERTRTRGCHKRHHHSNVDNNVSSDVAEQMKNRIRSRQARMQLILTMVHMTRLKTPNVPEATDLRGEQVVYYPQCSGPRNFSGLWNDGSSLRLFFNLQAMESTPRSRQMKIESALLYIQRKPTTISNNLRAAPSSSHEVQHPGNGHETAGGAFGKRGGRKRGPARGVNENASPGRGVIGNLKVVVYSYNRPNKRGKHETRSVVRSVTFPRQDVGWLRINLKHVVEEWFKTPQTNLGLLVTIQNEGSADELHASEYFDGTNCSYTQVRRTPIQLPSMSEVEWSGVNESVVDLDINVSQPFLEIIFVEDPISKSRHKRDIRTSDAIDKKLDDAEWRNREVFGANGLLRESVLGMQSRRIRGGDNGKVRRHQSGQLALRRSNRRSAVKESKKEKSTDCDSALIPLLCVHG